MSGAEEGPGSGCPLIVRLAATEPMAEGDEVFVTADPWHSVLLED